MKHESRSEEDLPEQDEPHRVTIFGGGITGLSAAHEFVERGFEVQVVERATSREYDGECEVGGMARTQYGMVREDEELGPLVDDDDWPNRNPTQSREPDSHAGPRLLREVVPIALARKGGFQRAYPVLGTPQRIYFAEREQTERRDSAGHQHTTAHLHKKEQTAFERGRYLAKGLEGAGKTATDSEEGDERFRPNLEKLFEIVHLLIESHLRPPIEFEVIGHVDGLADEPIAVSQERAESVITAIGSLLPSALEDQRLRFLKACLDRCERCKETRPKDTCEDCCNNKYAKPKYTLRDFDFRAVARGASEPLGSDDDRLGRRLNNRVTFNLVCSEVPGEHGYRHFPAFYRHLDDLMSRTPLFVDGRPTRDTTLDNLQPTAVTAFALEDGLGALPMDRRRPRSFEELRRDLSEMQERLGFPLKDIGRFSLKLTRFVTMSSKRRKAELEDVSWWNFVDGPRYSPDVQHQIKNAPQALVAMSAEETDARTHGNMTVQLLMDQLKDGTRADRTLAGPTSEAWLAHWKAYLKHQGVQFFVGRLEGLERCDGHLDPVVRGERYGAEDEYFEKPIPEPVYRTCPGPGGEQVEEVLYQEDNDYYVLALPLKATQEILEPVGNLQGTLREVLGFEAGHRRYVAGPHTGALRDFSGLQFYFDHDFKFAQGHVYYPHAEWGLSSISQQQFWLQRAEQSPSFLGVLSVDLGQMHEVYGTRTKRLAQETARYAAGAEQLHALITGREQPAERRPPGPPLRPRRRWADVEWRSIYRAYSHLERPDVEPTDKSDEIVRQADACRSLPESLKRETERVLDRTPLKASDDFLTAWGIPRLQPSGFDLGDYSGAGRVVVEVNDGQRSVSFQPAGNSRDPLKIHFFAEAFEHDRFDSVLFEVQGGPEDVRGFFEKVSETEAPLPAILEGDTLRVDGAGEAKARKSKFCRFCGPRAEFDELKYQAICWARAVLPKRLKPARTLEEQEDDAFDSCPFCVDRDGLREAIDTLEKARLRRAGNEDEQLVHRLQNEARKAAIAAGELLYLLDPREDDNDKNDGGKERLDQALALLALACLTSADLARGSLLARTAWNSEAGEMAAASWEQIKAGLDRAFAKVIPNPRFYHVDQTLEYCKRTRDGVKEPDCPPLMKPEEDKKKKGKKRDEEPEEECLDFRQLPCENGSLYQINRVGQFRYLPGTMPLKWGRTVIGAIPETSTDFYEVVHNQWVVAGSYTKTYTRLPTMELSNEAARHAVNAVLNHALTARKPWRKPLQGDLCRIFDPEDHEIDDLAILKRIDEALLEEGLPHWMDILEVDAFYDRIVPDEGEAQIPMGALISIIRNVFEQDFDPVGRLREFVNKPPRQVIDFLTRLVMKPR